MTLTRGYAIGASTVMDRSVRRSFLPSNLPQLQNLIKRDSSAYKEEFLQQLQHYQALTDLFLIDPTQNSQKLQELVIFISQVTINHALANGTSKYVNAYLCCSLTVLKARRSCHEVGYWQFCSRF